jgi:molecular chaperone GrpE (heat shock protein)
MSMPTMMRRPENAYTGKLRQEYVRALVRNIYRDQSLLDQAIELTDLRNEMQTIQDRYQQVKAEEDERKQAARRERREQQRQNSSQIARPRNPRL